MPEVFNEAIREAKGPGALPPFRGMSYNTRPNNSSPCSTSARSVSRPNNDRHDTYNPDFHWALLTPDLAFGELEADARPSPARRDCRN